MVGPPVTLVGRDAELSTLDDALSDAAQGRPRLVLIVGEAGIGKTSLVLEAVRRARARGFAVGTGACVDLSTGLPFLSLRFALSDLAADSGIDAGELVRHHGPELAAVLGSASGARPATAGRSATVADWAGTDSAPAARGGPGGAGPGDVVALLEGLLGMLAEVGARQPVMVALEDVHWIDPASRDVLAYLVRQLIDQRLLLLVTYRDDLTGSTAEATLFTELARLPFVERLQLAGLGREAVTELARHTLAREPEVDLVADVFRRSGGNPFFVMELLADDGGYAGRLPASIREVVERRVEDLPPAAAEVLAVVAVMGRPTPTGLLGRLVAWSEEGLDEALRQGSDAGVLVYDTASDEVAVRHALMAEVAYERLLPSARRRLHSVIGAELDHNRSWLDPSIVDAVLAHHHERAGELPEALAASIRAARRSASRFAFADAVVHFRRAVQLWHRIPDPESATATDLLTLLLEAADAGHLAGEEDAGLEFIEVARRLVSPRLDPAGWAAVARREVEARWLGGDMAGALTVAETASQALADAEAAQDAWFEERRAGLLLQGARFSEARDVSAAVRQTGQDLGDQQLEAGALLTHGVAVAALGDVTAGLAELAEARLMGLALQDPELTARTTINQLLLLLAAGRLDEARALGTEGLRMAGELGVERSYVVPLVATLATSLYLEGAWDEAERVLADAPRPAWVRDLTYISLARALLATGRGQLDEAERWLADASIDESGNVLHALHRAGTATEVALLRGRPDEVIDTVEEWLPVARTVPDISLLRLVAAGLAALARRSRAQLDPARTAQPDPAWGARRDPALGTQPDPASSAKAAEWLALVDGHAAVLDEDRPADADAWHHVVRARADVLAGRSGVDDLRSAAEAFDACRFVVRAAEVRVELAESLAGRDAGPDTAAEAILTEARLAEARRHAERALEVARRVGAELLAARAAVLLDDLDTAIASAGVATATDAAGRAAAALGLTVREVEVLRLVAEGLTNREIGQRLYISTKTASVHVSNILRKLDTPNRSAAAAAARRAGVA